MSAAILVSPGPVDGYPPVQHQARLLADRGFRVTVVTTSLPLRNGAIDFSHSGVSTIAVAEPMNGPLRAARRARAFLSAIFAARRRARGARIVEVAYDPLGMLYSDIAPGRPRIRLAHFHECLQGIETSWIERRLTKTSDRFQARVVADVERGDILVRQLGSRRPQFVVPNYPMSAQDIAPTRTNGSRFSVVYCGAVGLNQKLDFVVSSIPYWPRNTVFKIVGNANSAIGEGLRALAASLGVSDRVEFAGWVDYRELRNVLSESDLGMCLLDPKFEQLRTALGASNKRYQYMQAGLPQIGDMNPGVKAMLEGDGIGACLSEYSPTELARLVAAYVNDPERRRSEGRRASALHLTRYNYETAFQPVLDWIDTQLMTGGP